MNKFFPVLINLFMKQIWHNLNEAKVGYLFKPEHVISAVQVKHGKPAPDIFREPQAPSSCSWSNYGLVVIINPWNSDMMKEVSSSLHVNGTL